MSAARLLFGMIDRASSGYVAARGEIMAVCGFRFPRRGQPWQDGAWAGKFFCYVRQQLVSRGMRGLGAERAVCVWLAFVILFLF